jgi:site-specific recombinase XerD
LLIQKAITDGISERARGERTVNRDLQELKTMFNKIITEKRWRTVLENPASYVQLGKERNERIRYLDAKQITNLLAWAPKHQRPILIMALHTGMRHAASSCA